MEKKSKIYIAGHTGLVGSALTKSLNKMGFSNILVKNSKELDLTNQASVNDFFANERPEYVFLAAAKVGGIYANNIFPADFININLLIQSNVINACYKNNVKRLLFLGSSCIYPKLCPQPIKEEYLLTGLLEETNAPYALAKIAGLKLCEAFNRQYDTEFIGVMPTNLYGPGDNFDLDTSHVLPALIRKFHEALIYKKSEVVVWGSGQPRREFLFVDDMVDGCLFVMDLDNSKIRNEFLAYPKPCFVNLGSGVDLSIQELANMISKIVGFEGKIIYDQSKPDGTPRKLLSVERMNRLGWSPKISLEEGIRLTYNYFLNEVLKSP